MIGSWQAKPKIGRLFQMPEMKRGLPTPQPIGSNIVRTAEFENRAEQSYRTEVEKQLKADAMEVRDVSNRAKAALGKIAMAKDDRERAEAFKAVTADQEISREIATFRKSIE